VFRKLDTCEEGNLSAAMPYCAIISPTQTVAVMPGLNDFLGEKEEEVP
jgi:hypothetical protein